MDGKKRWYFPDGEAPPMGDDPEVYGHESIIVMNPNKKDAHVTIWLYWTDREPTKGPTILVEAERVRCVRSTEKCGFLGVPTVEGEQYAIMLDSDTPVIAQYGRLDIRQPNMAFYTTPGYAT